VKKDTRPVVIVQVVEKPFEPPLWSWVVGGLAWVMLAVGGYFTGAYFFGGGA